MSSGDLFEKISSFVEAHLMETGQKHVSSLVGPKYVFEHSLRVAFWSWRLALEMHADVSRCVAAGLLHDVSRFESENPDKQDAISAETARNFMQKEGFKKEFIDAVVYAIENQVRGEQPRTLETKILHDANKIDEFGYFRLLIFAKTAAVESFSSLEGNTNSLLAEIMKLEKGEHGPMWTPTGKSRMQTQIGLYKTFLNGLVEEIENTKTTMQ
jgi:putative nucleotidyltransferase with HDIG domain